MTQSLKKADEIKKYIKDTYEEKWHKAELVRNNKLAMDHVKDEIGFERYNKDLDEISQKQSVSVRNFNLSTKRDFKRRMSYFERDFEKLKVKEKLEKRENKRINETLLSIDSRLQSANLKLQQRRQTEIRSASEMNRRNLEKSIKFKEERSQKEFNDWRNLQEQRIKKKKYIDKFEKDRDLMYKDKKMASEAKF